MTAQRLTESAYALHRLGQREEALQQIQQAVSLAPRDPHILNTRGMMLDSLGRHAQALEDFERVLRISPNHADALNNRGIHYARVGRFEDALACYERSLAQVPHQLQTLYNAATARLALGQWLRGFREFEIRWQLFPHEATRRRHLKSQWLGQWDVSGKTVLLHHEQGFGDTLQFARYAIQVMRLGARVILAVPAALGTLMRTLPGAPQIIVEGDPIPAHDYGCSLMSLPHIFCTTPESVPAELPYLRAQPEAVQRWGERLGSRCRARIGLVWTGRRYPPVNSPRDMTLESLQPLLQLDADFVCLQAELSAPECTSLAAEPNVIRYGDVFEDFADTAALIENLDLIITVDTAVAHLAGALGKPVWVMNRYASCWRWLQRRPDSPWYPQLRLFRQPSSGDWLAVVRQVCDAAAQFLAYHAPRASATPPNAYVIASLLNSALAEHHSGEFRQAIESYRRVLRLDGQQPEAQHFLGVALCQSGQHGEALTPLAAAVRLQPDNAAAHNHYGHALAGLGRHAEALASYERAIGLDDTLADAHYNCGTALSALQRPEAALESLSRAIALKPDHLGAHNNRGNALCELARYPEALACYEEALQVRRDFISAWVNKAHALRYLGRLEDACDAARRGLLCDPQHAQAHCALGAALAALGQYESALSSYKRALELEPTLAEAVWNQALVHLSQGHLRQGWLGYESRWQVRSLKLSSLYNASAPWLGAESVEGKVVLVHAEQGYGDSLQFCRYASLLAEQGAHVILGVPGPLHRVMNSLAGVAQVISQPPIPAFDLHCPLLSLPLAFGTELTNIPAAIPYLQADDATRLRWAGRLGASSEPRVGWVWCGSATHTNDLNRSIALAQLQRLFRGDIRCISLQKEIRPDDALTLAALPALERLGEHTTDFADTAALLCELDLIVTVDTSVAHLAGALGRPVWILLPYVSDWRWLQEREDSPWYPTARLFRQPRAGDWCSVIDRVAAELDTFIRHLPARIAQLPARPLACSA